MSEEIEKQLLELVGIANGTRAGQITHKIEEIKLMFSTTRREAVEDFVNYIEDYFAEDFSYIRYEIEEYLARKPQ